MNSNALRWSTSLALIAALAISSCSSIPDIPFIGGDDDSEAEAIEQAGRIAMVLGDEVLVADPALAAEAIILPDAEILAEWPEAGSQPTKIIGHVAAGQDMDIAWRRDAGAGSSRSAALSAAPIATSERIYVLDSEQTVSAFDLETGNSDWSERIRSGNDRDRVSNGGGIAISGDTLIVASGYGLVRALDANTGELIWNRTFDNPMTGSPTVKDGRIFVTSNNNEVFTLSLETGAIEWTDQAISETARVLGSPSPAAVEDIVVVPYSSGEVIAYLASNGRRLWEDALSRPGRFTPISSINDIAARPVLSGGLVIAANQSGVTAAIDGRSGNRVWAQAVGSTQAPAVVGQYVFIAGTDAVLAALNLNTGQVYWATQMQEYRDQGNQKGRISYSGPIVASGRIIVISSRGDMLAFDPQTGEQVAELDLGDNVYLEPISVGDALYVLTDEARLIAIR